MADTITTKKYLDLEGLKIYDEKLKTKVAADDATTLQSAKDYADDLKTTIDESIKTNTDAIAVLNGDATTDGSVAKSVKDASDAINNKIGTVPEDKTVMGVVQEIQDSAYDDTALSGRVTTVEGAITTLNGTGDGSVKKQIDDAFNEFATNVSDDGVKNTFKELVDYCATHSSEAAEMAGNIADNATAIAELEAFVGTLPEGADAQSIIDYINKKVAAVDFTDAIATAKQEAIDAAKTYTDGVKTAIEGSADDTSASTTIAGAKKYTDALAEGAVATNATNITNLTSKVEAIQPISNTEIETLFTVTPEV